MKVGEECHTWLMISSTREKGARAWASSVKLIRYRIVVGDRSYWKEKNIKFHGSNVKVVNQVWGLVYGGKKKLTYSAWLSMRCKKL